MKPSLDTLRLPDGTEVVVIDNLSRDPEHLRAEAIGDGYEALGDFYPGRRKPVGPSYFAEIGAAVGSVLRTIYGCRRAMRVQRVLYSIVSTDPAGLSNAQRIPHVDDSSSESYAMVHYLAHGPFGGTAFFRHRSTGLTRVTSADRSRYLATLSGELAAMPPAAAYPADGSPHFERIGSAAYAFNRAIIYPGNLLHCSIVPPAIAHPDDPALGRLTIASFLLAE